MHLSPKEIDKLMLHNAGFLAQKRYARGLKLNYVETVALLSSQILEFIRDGDSVAELMEKGKSILGLDDVMPGVETMLPEVQVEGTFPDGTKLVTIHNPLSKEKGKAELALYGSGLSRNKTVSGRVPSTSAAPGETKVLEDDIIINEGRESISIDVLNTGDRPVQVGSHYPFFETNPKLEFDREASFGKRLDIPAGTAVRFEPGEKKTVQLVEIAGGRIVMGGNGITRGGLDDSNKKRALSEMREAGFADTAGK